MKRKDLTREQMDAFARHYGQHLTWFNCSLCAEIETECTLSIKKEIIRAVRTGKGLEEWGYGNPLNTNLVKALKKYNRKGKAADIGAGNDSPYPSFLFAFDHVPVVTYDIRKPTEWSAGIEPRAVDLSTEKGKPEFDIVTCISVLEHIGLTRYGDKLSPDGDIFLAQGIWEIIKPGGIFIFAVPLGFAGIYWNVQRIYNQHRLDLLMDGFEKLDEIGERMSPKKWRPAKQPIIVGRKK